MSINLTEIIINLLIIILTTGITYYLFTARPRKKRKSSLKNRLKEFRENLTNDILENEDEFRKSYKLYEEETTNGQEGAKTWFLIDIQDWSTFKTKFGSMLLLDTMFNDYWNGKELMFLINNLVTDDKNYIELSTKLSELDAKINHTNKLIGDKADNFWEVKSESELIDSKRDRELINMVVKSMEDVQQISRELVEIIDEILD